MFFEGSYELAEVASVIGEGLVLEVQPWGGGSAFRMRGSGYFVALGHQCDYDSGVLTCDGRLVDTSQGGVVFKADGRLLPTNPLPAMAV